MTREELSKAIREDYERKGVWACKSNTINMQLNFEMLGIILEALEQEPREITLEDVKEYCKPRCLTIITDELLYELTHTKIKALEQEPKSEWQKDHEILKAYKVWLIKEYVVTADSKEEAIESAKFRYDYSNNSSYCEVWDKVQCIEYKSESEE